jgi:hypothetical protein
MNTFNTSIPEGLLKELKSRHKLNYECYRNDRPIIADARVVGFGRYLRASRLNKGYESVEKLAKATEIPAGIIFAMESGAILRDRIKSQHLQMLALVLDESMDRFQLILKPIPRPETISYHGMGYKQSRDKWRPYRPHRDKETPFFSK